MTTSTKPTPSQNPELIRKFEDLKIALSFSNLQITLSFSNSQIFKFSN
jgi:hypothetical protein